MKQAKVLFLFVLVFVMLFAGYANSSASGSDPPNPTASEAEEASETPEPAASATEKVLISVDVMTDELLSQYGSFTEFIEFEDEGYQKIVFTTNISSKNFSFIEVGWKVEDEGVTFFENKVLYSLEELTPAEPFVVTWMAWGAIPHRGISFVDETDAARYFYIEMSGEDGSLLLVEFENE